MQAFQFYPISESLIVLDETFREQYELSLQLI